MANVLSNLAINTAGIWQTIGTFATYTFWGLVALGVVWVIMYFLRYKFPLILIMEHGTTRRIVFDRGEKNKKTKKFKALKNKDIDFPYPESKHEFIKGKTPTLVAFIKNQSATFIEINDNEKFIPADYDMQDKMLNDLDATWQFVKKKEDFWDKYGAQILWVGSMGVFLIVIILILKRMDAIIELGKAVKIQQASVGKQVVNAIPLYLFTRLNKDEE